MKKANPFLQKGFSKSTVSQTNEVMTVGGTTNKTFILLILMLATAIYTWNVAYTSNLYGLMMFGFIGGLVFSVATIFVPKISHITAPLYALLEGLAIGGISFIYEMQYPGIVINAVLLTVGILVSLLILYKSGTIKVTKSFRTGIISATMAVGFVYLINIVLSFFGMSVPFLHSNGVIGIGISLVIIVIASLNLILDFDFIERGSNHGLPKHMEWYGAFGLMVTLVWLYLEILRFLSKLASRD